MCALAGGWFRRYRPLLMEARAGESERLVEEGMAAGDQGNGGDGARIAEGVCCIMFAYDVGFAVDLDAAEGLLNAGQEGASQRAGILKQRRRAPRYFEYHPAPLRVTQAAEPVVVGGRRTASAVDCVVYDFGAVSVMYRIDISGDVSGLPDLSEQLYENMDLIADSRRRVESLVETLRSAIKRPEISELVEDYAVFHIRSLDGDEPVDRWVESNRLTIAQTLGADRERLSEQEIAEALSSRISYSRDDAAIIDWNAAVLVLPDAEDVLAVLEYANVELLEMRFLDDRLDEVLDSSYEAMEAESRKWWWSHFFGSDAADQRRIARMQVDSALLFEGVNNAVKLVGDQYLARVYRLASARLHLAAWDSSILRKIETAESIYSKMTDNKATVRLEILEWIIIILIALSIVLMFVPMGK